MVKPNVQKGWLLKNVNALGIYSFEKTFHKDQVLRIDCQSFASKQKYEDHKSLYEDFRRVHVGGSRYSTLQYWLNKN